MSDSSGPAPADQDDIEPEHASEGEVEDSRASADIEPGQAFEGGVEDSRAPPVIGLEHASEGEVADSRAPDYGQDGPNDPEYDGIRHCIYTYLANLDGLVARGCADKFPYGAWLGGRGLWDCWGLSTRLTGKRRGCDSVSSYPLSAV